MSRESRYKTLRKTAQTFIEAYSFTETTGKPDLDLLGSLMSPNFTHSWGHNFMKSKQPQLQSTLDKEGFYRHLSMMVPFMESCKPAIHDIIVDEPASKVVVRNSFYMCPKGQGDGDKETPENDLIWILTMDETGEKIESAMEFLDATATARIGELIAKARQCQ